MTQPAIVLSVRSLGFDVHMLAMRALRAGLTPAEVRGQFFGMSNTAFRAGDVIGALIGTYLYGMSRFKNFELGESVFPGYSLSFFVNSILGVAIIIILSALFKETVGRDI